MKKLLVLFIMAVILTSCGSAGGDTEDDYSDAPAVQSGEYNDGTYTTSMFFEGEDGYQDNLTLVIEGGKIASVEWNGTPSDGGDDKRTASEKGSYEITGWHEQAALMEAKIIETQDPYAITLNDDGTTSEVPGVTIPVSEFIDMVDAVLYDAQQQPQE